MELELPEDIVRSMKKGEIHQGQLIMMICLEAKELGLSYREAVRRGRARTLPKTIIGNDLEFLVDLLPSSSG